MIIDKHFCNCNVFIEIFTIIMDTLKRLKKE